MEKNEPENFEKNSTKRYAVRITIGITYLLLPVMVILMMWSMINHHKKIEELSRINQEKSTLVREFENLKEDYHLVKTWNEDYEEQGYEQQIAENQNQIDRLIKEIRFKSDDIEEYRQEMAGLRKKLNDYIKIADSLEASARNSQEMAEVLLNSRDSLVRKIQSVGTIQKALHFPCKAFYFSRGEKITRHCVPRDLPLGDHEIKSLGSLRSPSTFCMSPHSSKLDSVLYKKPCTFRARLFTSVGVRRLLGTACLVIYHWVTMK